MKTATNKSWKASCFVFALILMGMALMLRPAASEASLRDTVTDAGQTGRLELVVIDAAVKDKAVLVNEILDGKSGLVDMEFVFLDPFRDGWRQLTEAVGRYEGLDAVHIVSHGRSWAVFLGKFDCFLVKSCVLF